MLKLKLTVEDLEAFKNTIDSNPAGFSSDTYNCLREHVKTYEWDEKSLEDKHVILLGTMRTAFSDEVVLDEGGSFFTDCYYCHSEEFDLDDSILLGARYLVEKLIDTNSIEGLREVAHNSIPSPLGACVIGDTVLVYFTVNLNDRVKRFDVKGEYVKIEDLFPTNQLELFMLSKLPVVQKKGGK